MKKVALMLVLMFAAGAAQAECYSDGIRVGTVQKISKKGYMMKSWEGELVMNGVKGNSAGVTNVWAFSVLNAQVAAVIEGAAMTGKSVALKYCQRNPMLPHPDIDSGYEVVQAVERN